MAPPTFVFFTNVATSFHFSYERFLTNQLRESFGFEGTPIRLQVRARRRRPRGSQGGLKLPDILDNRMTPKLFRAVDVCELAQVQPYVLRSWEKEFPGIGVQKDDDSPRLYRQSDVDQVLRIKQLVFSEGLTLAGRAPEARGNHAAHAGRRAPRSG